MKKIANDEVLPTDLKPCPFCGGEIEFTEVYLHYDENHIELRCKCCGMKFEYVEEYSFSSSDRARRNESFCKLWNRRATMKNEVLNGKERAAFIADMVIIVRETIDTMITLADKHNVDRDNAVRYFEQIFVNMAEVSTFQNWGE